jgi:hypothetical protein
MVGKFRQEDLSIYFFIKDLFGSKVKRVVDSYPYTEIENNELKVPCVSVEHSLTVDEGGELGSSWFRRTWAVDIFADNDTQRDELSDMLFKALDNAVPIRDYSNGFRPDGKSLAGADLRVIEWANVERRVMRPTYAFPALSEKKFWRTTITFNTVTTQAT